MKLASLLQPELILCRQSASSYEEAQDMLLGMLAKQHSVDRKGLREALGERESLTSTVVAPGIGFPHARTDLVEDFYILIGTFPDGVAAVGEEAPVRLVVMYLMTEGTSNLYLRCVSSMARFLSSSDNLETLIQAEEAEDLIRAIGDAGVQVKESVTARDIMVEAVATCSASTTLREAADLMVRYQTMYIPVVGQDHAYQGMITANRLMRVGLPDYLLEMDGVDFLRNFEPFQDLLKQEQSMTVGEILSQDIPAFLAHTPIIIVASKLVRENGHCGAVIDESKRLVGIISGMEFVHKVIRV